MNKLDKFMLKVIPYVLFMILLTCLILVMYVTYGVFSEYLHITDYGKICTKITYVISLFALILGILTITFMLYMIGIEIKEEWGSE